MSNGDGNRGNDWIQLYGGDKFFLTHPTKDQIHASDIAHSLAYQPRYLGHAKGHYSIAEHCCHMADYEYQVHDNVNTALWALLHDATEAYMPDFPRPWKRLPQFEFVREAEAELMRVIAERFELDGYVVPDHIDALDRRILADEATQIFRTGPTDDWDQWWAPGLGVEIQFWERDEAEVHYFQRLTGLIQLRLEEQRIHDEG